MEVRKREAVVLTSADEEGVGHESLEEVHLLQCLLGLQFPQLKLHSLPAAHNKRTLILHIHTTHHRALKIVTYGAIFFREKNSTN